MADKAHNKTDEKLEEMESALLCPSFKNFNKATPSKAFKQAYEVNNDYN